MRIIIPKSNSTVHNTTIPQVTANANSSSPQENPWPRNVTDDNDFVLKPTTSSTSSSEGKIRGKKVKKRQGKEDIPSVEQNILLTHKPSAIHHDEEYSFLFEELKRKRAFTIKRMASDGNCLFRAVADQIYGDADMHDVVRERCMNYMESERDHYSQFVTEDFAQYLARKRQDRCFGNNLEIQAISELYNRPIEIYIWRGGRMEVINLFHGQYRTDNPPIRFSYHHGNHYNSVLDPNNPSVGVGLGLPQLHTGVSLGIYITNDVGP
jgi:hypothetical protein